jgi:hypothetical protein
VVPSALGLAHTRHDLPLLGFGGALVVHVALASRLRVVLLRFEGTVVLAVYDDVAIWTSRLESPPLIGSTVVLVYDGLMFREG